MGPPRRVALIDVRGRCRYRSRPARTTIQMARVADGDRGHSGGRESSAPRHTDQRWTWHRAVLAVRSRSLFRTLETDSSVADRARVLLAVRDVRRDRRDRGVLAALLVWSHPALVCARAASLTSGVAPTHQVLRLHIRRCAHTSGIRACK